MVCGSAFFCGVWSMGNYGNRNLFASLRSFWNDASMKLSASRKTVHLIVSDLCKCSENSISPSVFLSSDHFPTKRLSPPSLIFSLCRIIDVAWPAFPDWRHPSCAEQKPSSRIPLPHSRTHRRRRAPRATCRPAGFECGNWFSFIPSVRPNVNGLGPVPPRREA